MPTACHDEEESSTTCVVVTTEFDTWMSWENARMINPQGMEHAIFLGATLHEDRTVDVTLEIPQADLDYLIAAVGEEYALSALEEALRLDASEIIEAADIEEALRLIPVTDALPLVCANTFAVTWSASEAVMVREAIDGAENDLRHVTLVRMGRDGDTLLLAVTLPPGLADEVRAEGVNNSGAGFPDGVLAKLVGLIKEKQVELRDDGWRPADGDIPF